MNRNASRRIVLAGISAAVTATFGGCTAPELSASDDNDDQPFRCGPDYRSLAPELEERTIVSADQVPGLSLAVPAEVESGTDFAITVTNESTRDVEIYDEKRFAIQALRDAGSPVTILGIEDDYEWDDRTITLSPNDGRSWVFHAEGSMIAKEYLEPYKFCSMMTPGRYRLVFWGLPDDSAGDPLALATEFEIVEQRDDEPASR